MVSRRLAVDLLVLGVELAWLYVLISLLSALFGVGRSAVSLPLSLVTALVAFFQARWVASLNIPLGPSRALGVVLAGATIYGVMGFQAAEGLVVFRAGWPLEVVSGSPLTRLLTVGGLGVVLFWWSGARSGLSSPGPEGMAVPFRIGLPVVIVGAVASTLIQVELGIMPAVYGFFMAAFAGFALDRLVHLELGREALRGTWGRLLVGSLGFVLGGSLLLAVFTESGVGLGVVAILGLVLAVFRALALVLVFFLGYLTEFVVNLLSPLVSQNIVEVMESVAEAMKDMREVEPPEGPSRLPEWIPFVLRWGAVSLVVAGSVLLLVRLFRSRRVFGERHTEEERESLRDQGSLMTDVADLIGHLLRRTAGRGRSAVRPFLRPEGPLGTAYRFYFALLLLASRRGLPRALWETPREFQQRLAGHLPPQETALLTDAFSRARYGGYPPSEEELAELAEAWERIQGEKEAEPES